MRTFQEEEDEEMEYLNITEDDKWEEYFTKPKEIVPGAMSKQSWHITESIFQRWVVFIDLVLGPWW